MTSISGSIPNLIGGVSQQPAATRLENTAEALENAICSVVTGLRKRPPFQLAAEIALNPTVDAKVSFNIWERPGSSSRVIMTTQSGGLSITNLAGDFLSRVGGMDIQTMQTYLQTDDPQRDIGLVPVGDAFYIYNKRVVVQAAPQDPPLPIVTGRATVVVENTAARVMWRIRQNGAVVAEFDRTGSDSPPDAATVAASLTPSGATRINNVISIPVSDATQVTGEPGNFLRVYRASIEQFSNLPLDEVDGRLVHVRPGPEDDADGYYVRYNAAERRWVETTGVDAPPALDPSTMPLLVQDNGDGTFTVTQPQWGKGEVGDSTSNEPPSFVDNRIEHMFLFRDRMCILSDENFTFSQVGDYRQFFRTSVSLLRDDDRIDGAVTVPGESMVRLRSALAFDGNLYLFADKAQIKLEFNDGAPGQFRAVPLSNFEVSPDAKPTLLGDRALFADAGGGVDGWARVREYRLEAVSGTNQAEDITRQIPRFIPSGVYAFATSTAVDAVHVLSRGAPEKMFRYDYYITSEGRVQSAWNSWEVPGYTFEGAGVTGRQLVVLLKGYGKRFLAFANIEDAFDPDVEARTANLDLRIRYLENASTVRFEEAGEDVNTERATVFPDGPEPQIYTWNGLVIQTDESEVLGNGSIYPEYTVLDGFPYWTEELLWVVRADTGEPVPGIMIGNPAFPSTWKAAFPYVDLRGVEFFVGPAVSMLFKFSPIYLRDPQKTTIHDGRLQLRYLSVMFNDTVSFRVRVNTPGYPNTTAALVGSTQYTNTSDGFLTRGELTFPGPATIRSGKFRLPVATRGEALDATLTDDGPFQCAFSSIEWEGSWRPRTRRMSR